jgi:effector-binding domain-containing protein
MVDSDDARKRALQAEYIGRINRVMDYIETHLDDDLSLGVLARVASFSEFYFHRIFKGYDDPDVTENERLRVDVAMTVPKDTQVDGEVGKNAIPAGKYAVGRFELSSQEFEEAWAGVMGGWLPQSGYQCDDGPCFEIYQNDPKEHPEGKCIVDICVPVKPL